MQSPSEHHYLIKFLVASATFFFIGTVHGVLQVLPPIRAYLDSIGSPMSGPGHMIDPLAHAHINVVGGLVMLGMAVTYYLLPVISGKPLWSRRLVDYSFWGVSIGVTAFYVLLIIFGIVEGNLLLTDPKAVPEVHRYYAPIISVASTVMGIGFWMFFINVFFTAKAIYKRQ
jgi:heme/copper-type cytochrome/quinol oxidase subunit 1